MLTAEELQDWSHEGLIEAVLSWQSFAMLTSEALDKVAAILGELHWDAAAIAEFPAFPPRAA